MKKALFLAICFSSQIVFANPKFPSGPHLQLTPGEICSNPTSRRYPEKIPYCERDVDSSVKLAVIKNYDRTFGYRIQSMSRKQFKIDHFIPLCMGGSNEKENLWPQHSSISRVTDPLEPLLCEKMAEGKLSQAEAIEAITEAKLNLKMVPALIREVQSL